MNLRRHIARLQGLFHRGDPVEELDQEIQMHLELEEEENRALGMPLEEARYAAHRAFGNISHVKEDVRGR